MDYQEAWERLKIKLQERYELIPRNEEDVFFDGKEMAYEEVLEFVEQLEDELDK